MNALENFETKKPPPGFPWLEQDLAMVFGFSDKGMAAERHALLIAGTDFRLHKKRIFWSEDGVKKVAAANHMTMDDLASATMSAIRAGWLEMPPEGAGRPVVELRVFPRRTVNPHIIFATNGGPDLLRVRVKDKEKCKPGVWMRCQHVSADLYEFVGWRPRKSSAL